MMIRSAATSSVTRALLARGATRRCYHVGRQHVVVLGTMTALPTSESSKKVFTTTKKYNTNFQIQTRNFGSAGFSMAQLKELRALSGAPIVECKKALGETDGDVGKAIDWLREHGAAKASKKVSGRDADEGLVACEVSDDGKLASLVKVSSETDFAGKSPAFVSFVDHVAKATLGATSDENRIIPEDDVKNLEYDSKSVQTALEDAIVAIRENLGIPLAIQISTDDDGLLCSYVHGKVDGGDGIAGSAAAVVEIKPLKDKSIDTTTMKDAGKKLAMHIVAAKPSYLNPESVPSDIVDKEKSILLSQVSHIVSGLLR